MSGQMLPGPLGTDAPFTRSLLVGSDKPHGAGFEVPGPIGGDAIPLGLKRIITEVTIDWDPPVPKSTPEIVVDGATLADVAAKLDKLEEWGRGGGKLRTEEVLPGNSEEVTVKAHANLIRILPRWTGYDKASPKAQAEWDRMFAALVRHEERHVEIAVEEANGLKSALLGAEIGEIGKLVTAANKEMARRQKEFDDDTDHGAKKGVDLDITIT